MDQFVQWAQIGAAVGTVLAAGAALWANRRRTKHDPPTLEPEDIKEFLADEKRNAPSPLLR